MKRLILLSLLLAGIVSSLSAQNVYHKYIMRGTILDVSGPDIYLCVGKTDGATVGQEMDVFRIDVKSGTNPKSPPIFTRVKLGRIQITELVQEHYARAKVLSGSAPKGSIAELQKGK